MDANYLLLAILVPSFGTFTLLALWLYFAYNRKAEAINANSSIPSEPVTPVSGESGNEDQDPPDDPKPHHQPTKINPLALDLVLTLGTVYMFVSAVLALSLTGNIQDATVGVLFSGMIGFVLGNRLGKSI